MSVKLFKVADRHTTSGTYRVNNAANMRLYESAHRCCRCQGTYHLQIRVAHYLAGYGIGKRNTDDSPQRVALRVYTVCTTG